MNIFIEDNYLFILFVLFILICMYIISYLYFGILLEYIIYKYNLFDYTYTIYYIYCFTHNNIILI